MSGDRPSREIRPWRPCPFVAGCRYRVLVDFTAMRDDFHAGEILVFPAVAPENGRPMGVWTLIALFGGAMGVLGTVLSDRAEYDLSRKGSRANMRLHGIAVAVGLAGWLIAVVGIVIDLLDRLP